MRGNFDPSLRREFLDAKDAGQKRGKLEEAQIKGNPELYNTIYNRDGADYLRSMQGLEFLFKIVRKSRTPKILDAGAGIKGRGILELSKTLAKGIDVYGVGLSIDVQQVPQELRDHFFISDYENFRGIKPGTINGIISIVGAFEYSEHPDLVAHKTQKLLAPDGILKATFSPNRLRRYLTPDGQDLDLIDGYTQFFRNLDYAVATTPGMLLAIKPGPSSQTDHDAMNILSADQMILHEQIVRHELLLKSDHEGK